MRIDITRNPFKIDHLTRLMRRYKFASEVKKWFPGIGKKWIKGWVAKTAKKKNNLDLVSTVLVQTHDGFPQVMFKASEINSQLHSIYFSRYQEVYEPDIECCMEIMLPQAKMFVDIGANWGYFIGKAACMNPKLELLAFEPTSLSFGDLESLCSGFSKHAEIKAFQVALGEEEGKATIAQPGFESGLASIITAHQRTNGSVPAEQVEVKTLGQFELLSDSIIKIDVEGFELNVLQGGKDQIAAKKPAIIFEHWHVRPNDLNPFLDFFNELGYVLYKPTAYRLPPEGESSDERHIPMDFTLDSADYLDCDRRYNLLAVHPSSKFFRVIDYYAQISQ